MFSPPFGHSLVPDRAPEAVQVPGAKPRAITVKHCTAVHTEEKINDHIFLLHA